MKLEEAIRIIEEGINYSGEGNPPKFEEACNLGIEALKRLKNTRVGSKSIVRLLLPGETEE